MLRFIPRKLGKNEYVVFDTEKIAYYGFGNGKDYFKYKTEIECRRMCRTLNNAK